jgi:diguanylate cyclase (GGDEF)-like protein
MKLPRSLPQFLRHPLGSAVWFTAAVLWMLLTERAGAALGDAVLAEALILSGGPMFVLASAVVLYGTSRRQSVAGHSVARPATPTGSAAAAAPIAFTGADTERPQRAENRLRRDRLTGLANRPLLMHHLTMAMTRRRAPDNSGALLLIDIDHFKLFNDCLGHAAGDSLLTLLADRLQRSLPVDAIVARLNADEFVVVLGPGTTAETAALQAVGLRDVLARPVPLDLLVDRPVADQAPPLRPTVCIGISVFPHDGGCATELLQCANAALQRAKAAGCGSVRAGPGPQGNLRRISVSR